MLVRFVRFRATFSCHRHSTLDSQAREGLHQLWALPWLLLVALLLPGLSVTVLPQALRFWLGIFYPEVFFTLRSFSTFLTRFVTQMHAETPHSGSFSVPVFTELSLSADACIWTTHIVVTRPLIYQLRQWSTKYRVQIKLLNIFRLFKVYGKTIKTLWTKLDKKYCLKQLNKYSSKLIWKSSHPKSS